MPPGLLKPLALLTALLLLACQQSSANPAPVETTFTYDPGVSEEDRVLIEEGVAIGKRFVEEVMGLGQTAPITVSVNSTSSSAPWIAYAWENSITVYTGLPDWSSARAEAKRKILVHEYFHIIQHHWNANLDAPTWFVEGSAEVVAYEALINAGLTPDRTPIIGCHVLRVTVYMPSPLPALKDMDTRTPGVPYSLFYLAVQRLVERSGLSSLSTFAESTAAGAEWPVAFQKAFGVTPDAFYGEFEQYRQTLTRPAGSPCSDY